MKNNETGEYELVVGNPQLLSAFFIVVLLCGVAFAMGYVVGQNSPRSAKTTADTSAPVSTPATADTRSAQPITPPADSGAAQQPDANAGQTAADDAAKPAEAPPQPTTQPARDMPPAPAVAPPVQPAPEAPAGSYWQVAAYNRPADAQPISQTLKDGNMPVVVRQGADGLTHVLVGPYPDAASLSKARDALVSRFGIASPIRK